MLGVLNQNIYYMEKVKTFCLVLGGIGDSLVLFRKNRKRCVLFDINSITLVDSLGIGYFVLY